METTMRDGPDLARVASLVGDPARGAMLSALMGGIALTATELALEAGVSLPTASSHLARLGEGGLVTVNRQGRHRYYALADAQVAGMLEAISGVAATLGPARARPGPRDQAMRKARVCYDHLAGDMAVAFHDQLVGKKFLRPQDGGLALTEAGRAFFVGIGVDLDTLEKARRPLCRSCLDWSVRRSHLAGALGAATLETVLSRGWARRIEGTRVVAFTPPGERAFARLFDS